ncbi:aminotransferase, partial [Candidatus Saccharibacteria bacterium 32-49-10]
MKQELIYLDHAAATPVDPVVLDAMLPYFTDKFFNPSSPYSLGVEVKRDYQLAKSRIARTIGAKSDEIIMTAGATESINIAFSSASGKILVPSVEHVATLAAAERQGEVTYIQPDKKGRISVDS